MPDIILNGNPYNEASFQGQGYADANTGFLPCLSDVVAHCEGIYRASSTSALTVGEGPKSLVCDRNRPISVNSWVRIQAKASAAIYMEGPVTAYDPSTGALSMTVAAGDSAGAGILSAWDILTTGRRGKDGNAGTLATNTVAGVIAVASKAELDARLVGKAVTADLLADGLGLRGDTIASASTLTLPAIGDYFFVTGTTTINAISARQAGRVVKLYFNASLTLTHSSTLVLPSGVNITASAGDMAEFVADTSGGVWRLSAYRPAVGSVFSGMSLISRQVISSAVAQVDFISMFSSTPFDTYRVLFSLVMDSSAALRMRYGLGSFATTGYYWAYSDLVSSATSAGFAKGQNAAEVTMMGVTGVVLTSPISGEIVIDRPGSSIARAIRFDLAYQSSVSNEVVHIRGASGLTAGTIDRLRLYPSAGNISAGVVSIYGMRAA